MQIKTVLALHKHFPEDGFIGEEDIDIEELTESILSKATELIKASEQTVQQDRRVEPVRRFFETSVCGKMERLTRLVSIKSS